AVEEVQRLNRVANAERCLGPRWIGYYVPDGDWQRDADQHAHKRDLHKPGWIPIAHQAILPGRGESVRTRPKLARLLAAAGRRTRSGRTRRACSTRIATRARPCQRRRAIRWRRHTRPGLPVLS